MNRTWSKGRWHFRSTAALYEGIAQMLDNHSRLQGSAFDLRYEDLIAEPQGWLDTLLVFIGLGRLDIDEAYEPRTPTHKTEARFGWRRV